MYDQEIKMRNQSNPTSANDMPGSNVWKYEAEQFHRFVAFGRFNRTNEIRNVRGRRLQGR